jgi:HD-GYP domain-containing protein (c-di-GMP phosphodiesterase class II)
MSLDYNIFLEVAVIPLDIALYAYLFARYKTTPNRVSTAFRRFVFAVLLTDILDVVTAIVTSAHEAIPNWVHHLFNMADSFLASQAAFLFIYYIYAYSTMNREASKIRNGINYSLLIVNYIFIITNPLTGWFFTYDEGGNYIHGPLFTPIAYGFPILFFAIASIYMLLHREKYRKVQLVSMITAILCCGFLFILQMLFFDHVLITFFMASIGCLVIFLSLETPEYLRLVQTTAELKEAKAREALVQSKERLSGQVLLALSKAVDAKDHYTNGHSERVAQYAKEIARRMGKSEREQEEIYELGLLHDVGKIGVPGRIINKTERLTDEEFAEIKNHTTIGWDILKTINEIPYLSKGARWHHERFDGKGYPDGLKGKEIPEEARIICLADCYDAMTSRRSYSVPRPQAEVRAEIVRCTGTQFDPDIAKYLIDMIDEDTEYKLHGNLT